MGLSRHSSLAAARILLDSGGRCTGCDYGIDLTGEDARDAVHIRTVDRPPRDAPEVLIREADGWASYLDSPYPPKSSLPQLPPDWPGVLCKRCCTRMRDDGYRSLLAFRFSQHPKCPDCGAGVTQRARYGEPVYPRAYPPWVHHRGCVDTGGLWTCLACGNQW